MLLLSTILPVLTLAKALAKQPHPQDSFHESLTLHPLPDGKLSVLFEFTTTFTSHNSKASSSIAQSHHTLTPPSLLLPLQHNDVAELTISFVTGRWDPLRSEQAGPLHHESGGGGGEVRGWLRDDAKTRKDSLQTRWTKVTHALGGLFCAGLGPIDDGDSVNTFGDIYPPHGSLEQNLTHFYLPQPTLHLCTENLTPFLSLLPSKGISGLSSLLAQPTLVFAWGYKSEGIEIIMPSPSSPVGRWRGWWEGIVDLVPEKGGSRAFSIENMFRRGLPKAFPEADSSELKLIMPRDDNFKMDLVPKNVDEVIWSGHKRKLMTWDLLGSSVAGTNINFWWDGERDFIYPRRFASPPLTISRTVIDSLASDGTFSIRIKNDHDRTHSAIYSEVWPWWVKGWLHQISISQDGALKPELVEDMFYEPSTPPEASTTTLHLQINIPARSTINLKIPFTKLTLKYTEHRPDAERGREIPPGILTLLETEEAIPDIESRNISTMMQSPRQRLYTSRQLVDLPTPDFSMPYNVIIMTSTVMAVFFGLMHGALTRRWGLVEIESEVKQTPLESGVADGKVKGE